MAYTVALIDDESWALIGIYRSFSWEKYGFQVVLQETNVARALQFILEHRPDVVFTDIRMNSMSGLELIRSVREAGLDIEFIIISGYSDFAYAQSAIHSGVFQYLLKPLDIEETDTVLQALCGRLAQKRTSFSAYDWVDHVRSGKMSYRLYCTQKDLAPRFSRFYLATLGCADLPDELFRHPDIQVLDVVRFGLKKSIVLFCAQEAVEPVFSSLGECIRTGVSRGADADEYVYVGFRESDIAYTQSLFSGSGSAGFYRQDAARETAQVAARLASIFAAGSAEAISAAMQEGIDALSQCALTIEDLALLYNQILTGLMANRHYNFPAGLDPLDYRGVQALFHSREDFFRFLSELVNSERFQGDECSEKDCQQMTKILAYIGENYAHPLYLSDLSQRFFLSQTSICDLFRRSLKTSFMSYLTELRMQKAYELLASTHLSMMDIAENIGYRDQYYFSRIFKRQTGMTPQQYRRLHDAGKAGESLKP